MSHALERTSPRGKGQKFVGRCVKCGRENLLSGAALEDCPADGLMSDEEALIGLLKDHPMFKQPITTLEAAQARIAELEAALDEQPEHAWRFWSDKSLELSAKLVTTRAQALEEAAKVLDKRVREICDEVGDYDSTTNHVELPEWAETSIEELEAQAVAIRALKET